MHRAFCLAPTLLPPRQIARLSALQPRFNRLYDALSTDVDFLASSLAPFASECEWNSTELSIFRRVALYQDSKPRLLLPNSVFLEDHEGGEPSFVLTVGNVQVAREHPATPIRTTADPHFSPHVTRRPTPTPQLLPQAGEPYQLQLVHTFQSAQQPCILPTPLNSVTRAIATAARCVHPHTTPIVAILTKPAPSLALRTAIDVRGVGRALKEEHGVGVLFVSMADLARASVDGERELWLDGQRVSVVYSRYDFSHPSGSYTAMSQLRPTLTSEWETIERLERSRAVLSSTLGCRLAHRLVSSP